VRPEDFVLRPALWLNALSVTRATISPCPNFALKLCTDRVEDSEIASMDLSAWQIALVGAETVHLETLRAFAERFAPAKFRYAAFTPVYGLAEATLAVSFSSVEKEPVAVPFDRTLLGAGTAARAQSADAVEICSVGTALDGIDIEIRGESGALPETHVGRIFVQGASIMGGYLVPGGGVKPHNGALDTGDLGFFFEGELFIYGRAKDVIIINGRNYDPAYIEFATEGVPGLRHERTAAFAVETERGTEGFIVLVEKEKGDLRAESEMAGLVRSSVITKTGLIPDSVHIIDAGRMPRTTSGKVRRQEARSRFLYGSLVAIASASS
jgi:acyl-CoA synthetase (AMP-forming)/AMP-acid ligase II